MNCEELTFNVIYVKDSVRNLLPLFSSLLSNTECNYRLISNGCDQVEEGILSTYAEKNDRVSFYSLKSNHLMKHHEVLNHLVLIDESKYFAFIDSDMIAEGNFASKMLKELEGKNAVFTGLPIWHEERDQIMPKRNRTMGGLYMRTHNSIQLSLTYCSIYDRKSLVHFMNESGVGFESYDWDDLPIRHQNTLEILDLRKNFYDTGKVLSILWQHAGAEILTYDEKELIHIGGISGAPENNGLASKIRRRLSFIVPLKLVALLRIVYKGQSLSRFRESFDHIYLTYRRNITKSFFDKVVLEGEQRSKSIGMKTNGYEIRLQEVATKILQAKKDFDLASVE